MPYLLGLWCNVLEKPENMTAPDNGRMLRSVPMDVRHRGMVNKATSSLMLIKKVRMSQINMDVIAMTCELVKQELETIVKVEPSVSTEDPAFAKYTIESEKIVFSGFLSHIYEAKAEHHPNDLVMARVYEPNPAMRNTFWIRMLKHLGKRNPNLIGTFGIFHDLKDRMVLFQELAAYGNLREHITSTKLALAEPQVIEWAQQIYRAMDFLGTVGLCHRCICPKHIMMCRGANPEKVVVKLGSFRDAIVYFNPKFYQLNHQPCRDPSKRQPKDAFQAPEVFGNQNEEYDPIVADVWSYGATFFYAATLTMPYPMNPMPEDIELAIQQTVEGSKLTTDAVRWFSNLLKGNAEKRTTFDRVESDPWYQTFD